MPRGPARWSPPPPPPATPGSVGAAINGFLDDLTIAGRSPATIKTYGCLLRTRLPVDLSLDDLSTSTLRSIVAVAVRDSAPATAATRYGTLHSFCTFLCKSGLTPENLMARVPKPRTPEPQAKALTKSQMAALWDAACRLDAAEGYHRYRLIVAALSTTGLRRAELAGACFEDIEGDVLTVIGKGRKRRRVFLTAEVRALLGEGKGPIFGISASRMGQVFKHIAAKAGMPKAHCHQLRHTYFTEYIRAGGSIGHAVTLGGWSSDRMLMSTYAKSSVADAALDEARRMAAVVTVPCAGNGEADATP